MSLISVLKSCQSTIGPGGTWRHCWPRGVWAGVLTSTLQQRFTLVWESLGNQYPYFTAFHHPQLSSCSPALPYSVKCFLLEGKALVVSPCPGVGCLQACCSPPSFFGDACAPLQPYSAGCLWLGLPSACSFSPSRGKEQSQFTYRSAVPFLWAVDFLCRYPFCNIRAFYFILPLFWINPIIFIKKRYLWLLTHMRDADRSFLICLVSYKEN